MSTSMGPVESWLRFGLMAIMIVTVTGLFGWWMIDMGGPIWLFAAFALAMGAMVVVGYERLIGW